MRFTVRSLGGKLVISAALMLLLCILLFSLTSWYVLKSFYEHEAKSDTRKHLPIIQNAYRTQILSLERYLTREASNPAIVAALTTSSSSAQTANELASAKQKYHLASISIISQQGISLGDVDRNVNISLISQALKGETVTTLQMPELEIAAPIKNRADNKIGALIAAQDIED